jgi:hypothetical protein
METRKDLSDLFRATLRTRASFLLGESEGQSSGNEVTNESAILPPRLEESGAGSSSMKTANEIVERYFRCPQKFLNFVPKANLSSENGYFQFGDHATCFGRYAGGRAAHSYCGNLPNALRDTEFRDGTVYLPFDPSEVAANLREERYVDDSSENKPNSVLAKIYYFLRPILPVPIRKHLQRRRLRDWQKLSFPRWPVDTCVDGMFEQLMLLALRSTGGPVIPFIWFWPGDASGAAIMTHDVETELGRTHCSQVMDIDDSFGIRSSFQVIPEKRYEVAPEFLESIRARGFEIVIHDLNHDGKLYRDRDVFLHRARKLSAYRKKFGAEGFRAAILYRNLAWYDKLDFAYDMSVPNVAHLDPQRGGCCTVMPYFVGEILEIPVTTTQDYTLFHVLNDYSIDLWKRQIDLIMAKHGLMSFIVHPDYVIKPRERAIYESLLAYLERLRAEKNIWTTTPGEINRWWRQRKALRLVEGPNGWQIAGEGCERARIAYASEKDGGLMFSFSSSGCEIQD